MYEELTEILRNSDNIVFFGGAGVSTESNIPDFRSEAGLYSAQSNYGMSPEQMLSHSFFMRDTQTFFAYYKNNLIYIIQSLLSAVDILGSFRDRTLFMHFCFTRSNLENDDYDN